jgi:phage tail sheath protein FI
VDDAAARVSAEYLAPGVYVEETAFRAHSIAGVDTSATAFVGTFGAGALAVPQRITSLAELEAALCDGPAVPEPCYAVREYFRNGGRVAWCVPADASAGAAGLIAALDALRSVDMGLLVIPEATEALVHEHAAALCRDKAALLLVDPPSDIVSAEDVIAWRGDPARFGAGGEQAATYFPRIAVASATGQREIGPCGAVAGVIARADAAAGPWVVPAGAGAIVASATPRTALGEAEIEAIEAAGVNALRRLPGGETVVWGARLSDPAGEWKYVPVRRLALFIEHSLDQGLAWAAFEPNDEPLWAEVRTETATFMDCLFRSGAFTLGFWKSTSSCLA